jgi:outer membrane receptor protein involved in Fe transport
MSTTLKHRGRAPNGRRPLTPCLDPRSKLGLAVAAALYGAGAMQGVPALAADAASDSLEEITVTARKRTENLQEVPISIDVFTAKDLQNLAIANMDDYMEKVPSISFISTGPGTQVFVMRGVSDGSNPNYGNTSATGFFVDDMAMSSDSAQPDLHLYDVERIEILNGPQGTTFGAGSMSGAIRYITNKPDVNAFGAGLDLDGGKIDGGQNDWTYEGFVNLPLIDGHLGLRISAFSDSHGGFIDNRLTTRTWVNGSVSNNAVWAGNDYNREHIEGGRVALKLVLTEGWSGSLTYGYQRQSTHGAWDEDPTLPPRTVERFGPELDNFQTKMLDFHVDGDVGIGDLVFASTYWALPRRQWNEYSQYEQNYNAGAPGGFPGTQEGFTCLNDPYYGTGPYSGCKPPVQFYSLRDNTQRWSEEIRLLSKSGGRFHWLVGAYWERTEDNNYGDVYYMPGLQYKGAAFQYYLNSYGLTQPSLPAGQWYAYNESSYYLQSTEFANISFDLTDRLNVEAGTVHFQSHFAYNTPFVQFAYAPPLPSYYTGGSEKWNSKLGINYKLTDKALVYADAAQGFRDGGSNSGDPPNCYKNGVPEVYTPDTLTNYELGWKTTWLHNSLLWNGAAYLMNWSKLQTLLYNAEVCAVASYNVNIGQARIYGMESNLDYKINENLSVQGAASYTDSRIISTPEAAYDVYVNERLPFAPYFSWSWNARYEHPLGVNLHGYAQLDMAHKGDMWNNINPNDRNTGLPRILQPDYTLTNLRLGLNSGGARWLAEFYITNLTDKNAIVYSNTGNFDLRLTTNEPRVFGLRFSFRWGKTSGSAED